VNKAVLQYLHPEQMEVEICRADELAQRRGLTSELDEMWRKVFQTRVRTLNGEPGAIFKRWYPDMDLEVEEIPVAA
jgi:hypothetical protein